MKRSLVIASAVGVVVIATAVAWWNFLRWHVRTPTEITSSRLTPAPPVGYDCPAKDKALAEALSSSRSLRKKPSLNHTPMSPDEIAIYTAVIQGWLSNDRAHLYVSVRTFPLDPDSPAGGLSECPCLEGISISSMVSASTSFHELTIDILPARNSHLVDPKRHALIVSANDPDKRMGKGMTVDTAVKEAFKTGLFSISEIAFDQEHRHALVSYGFWCGSLCGSGATVVFEKVGDQWKRTDRACAGWIS